MNEKKTIKLEAELDVSSEEIEMVQMIANSMRPKEIAEKKGMNHRTVETHIYNMRKKFKVATPSGLVMLFYRNGLID